MRNCLIENIIPSCESLLLDVSGGGADSGYGINNRNSGVSLVSAANWAWLEKVGAELPAPGVTV
jgi:hypothetical protein